MKYFQQKQQTHSSKAHMKLSKTEQILGHKTHTNKLSYSELYYSDYNGIELEINNKKIAGKSPVL